MPMQALRGGAATVPTHSLGGHQRALAAIPIVQEGAAVGLTASLDSCKNLAPIKYINNYPRQYI